ncbi:hypothetical protein HYDPIDRAFT_190250 [Hydnomerulius pinastri MD-312]|uniref:Uncharacterized protein n=1 Tax=Hydnomerulius pinastri MD-312 TaxID=994086 RepID=A0A0C9WA14_9AGAM|nr:hypothetical protein HYDPIDRAFT_190250 [Hydnomerulius pinastri MD-312]
MNPSSFQDLRTLPQQRVNLFAHRFGLNRTQLSKFYNEVQMAAQGTYVVDMNNVVSPSRGSALWKLLYRICGMSPQLIPAEPITEGDVKLGRNWAYIYRFPRRPSPHAPTVDPARNAIISGSRDDVSNHVPETRVEQTVECSNPLSEGLILPPLFEGPTQVPEALYQQLTPLPDRLEDGSLPPQEPEPMEIYFSPQRSAMDIDETNSLPAGSPMSITEDPEMVEVPLYVTPPTNVAAATYSRQLLSAPGILHTWRHLRSFTMQDFDELNFLTREWMKRTGTFADVSFSDDDDSYAQEPISASRQDVPETPRNREPCPHLNLAIRQFLPTLSLPSPESAPSEPELRTPDSVAYYNAEPLRFARPNSEPKSPTELWGDDKPLIALDSDDEESFPFEPRTTVLGASNAANRLSMPHPGPTPICIMDEPYVLLTGPPILRPTRPARPVRRSRAHRPEPYARPPPVPSRMSLDPASLAEKERRRQFHAKQPSRNMDHPPRRDGPMQRRSMMSMPMPTPEPIMPEPTPMPIMPVPTQSQTQTPTQIPMPMPTAQAANRSGGGGSKTKKKGIFKKLLGISAPGESINSQRRLKHMKKTPPQEEAASSSGIRSDPGFGAPQYPFSRHEPVPCLKPFTAFGGRKRTTIGPDPIAKGKAKPSGLSDRFDWLGELQSQQGNQSFDARDASLRIEQPLDLGVDHSLTAAAGVNEDLYLRSVGIRP